MIVLFHLSVVALGLCAMFFWLHPKFDDCLWGRLGLLGTISAALIIEASEIAGYRYYNVLPEVILLLASQASYMGWLVWRFVRRRWRVARGLERDFYTHEEAR
jgi:hypothetical protein